VAFTSLASNLVAGDRNGQPDVFVHDRVSGATELASVGMRGEPGDDLSAHATMSADGRYVAFTSYASNLVPGDSGATWDVFVRDRATGTTERIDVDNGGIAAPAGRRIYSRATLSADGRFVAFSSDSSGLVAGDTNGTPDVFVRDRVAGTTERVSVGNNGRQLEADNGIYGAAISGDGRYVTFISGSAGIFVRDRLKGTTERVDVAPGGAEANGGACCTQAISDDGRYVAYMSGATNLVPGDTNGVMDVFVNDRALGGTERVSVGGGGQANGQSSVSGLSSHGSPVLFQSNASNLVPGDTNGASDIFERDLFGKWTEMVSAAVGPRPYVLHTTKSPRPPRAGRLYTVTLLLRERAHAVDTASVTARATVRHRVVPLVRTFFAESAAHAVWRVPTSARNGHMTVTISARTAAGRVTSTFVTIVR
jgi:Tol biopolymer transport system component